MKRVLSMALLGVVLACGPVAPEAVAPAPSGPFEHVAVAWDALPADDAGPKATASLTASDGTGLELVTYRAKAVADGPIAFTEIRFGFKNPAPRAVEGTFQVALPPSASVSRFAMRVGDVLQEAEVVELAAARRAYESFFHRRVDPALAERDEGNVLRARVFPITPGEIKEIVVSYTEERRSAQEPYRLRLRGLPKVDDLEVSLVVPSLRKVATLAKHGDAPDRDFVLAVDAAGAPADVAIRHDGLIVARVTPAAATAPDPIRDATILFDTSASRAETIGAEIQRLGALIEALRRSAGNELALRVACFDQEVAEIYAGPASGFGAAHLAKIAARGALGATDLAGALRWARSRSPDRVVLVSDGVATAALDEPDETVRPARLDVIAAGKTRDEARLTRLARVDGPRRGAVLDAATAPAEIAAQLATTSSSSNVRVAGAEWSWQAPASASRPGDQVIVHAEIAPGAPLTIDTGAGAIPLRTIDAPSLLLERLVASAKIAELSNQLESTHEEARRSTLRALMVEQSIRHRVLTPFTGWLVLEKDTDYQRFGIERRATRDTLSVGPEGFAITRDPVALDALPAGSGPQGTPLLPDLGGEAAPRQRVIVTDLEIRIIHNVQFAPGSDQPLPQSRPLLDEVAGVMRNNPWILEVEIGGHTDNAGSAADNVRMSEARARAVRAYLIGKGIEAQRLTAKGWGPHRPIVPNDSATNRAINRRVDFRVLRADRRPTPPVPRWFARGAKAPLPTPHPPPHTGRLALVTSLLAAGKRAEAQREARVWHDESPSDVLATIALGEALEANGEPREAARAYGSLLDLSPRVADVRRATGAYLERVSTRAPEALTLAIAAHRGALASRPDHPSSHLRLARALLRAGRPGEAFDILTGVARAPIAPERFPGLARVIADERAVVAAAWLRAEPARRAEILDRLRREEVSAADKPSLRISLTWESDASDLDLHVIDAKGEDAFDTRQPLASGGVLVADVTEGYGPEVFTQQGNPSGYPYRISVQSRRRGPSRDAIGSVDVIEHDGNGGVTIETRPFVIMTEGASVDLGVVTRR